MRLTSHEANLANACDTGMAGWDEDAEGREMSGLRAGWAILDGYVPRHGRNPSRSHPGPDELPTPGLRGVANLITRIQT